MTQILLLNFVLKICVIEFICVSAVYILLATSSMLYAVIPVRTRVTFLISLLFLEY